MDETKLHSERSLVANWNCEGYSSLPRLNRPPLELRFFNTPSAASFPFDPAEKQSFNFFVSQNKGLLLARVLSSCSTWAQTKRYLGVIPPLYMTAIRCHEPCIRSRAVCLLNVHK